MLPYIRICLYLLHSIPHCNCWLSAIISSTAHSLKKAVSFYIYSTYHHAYLLKGTQNICQTDVNYLYSWPDTSKNFFEENKSSMKEPRLSQELSSNEKTGMVIGSRNYSKENSNEKIEFITHACLLQWKRYLQQRYGALNSHLACQGPQLGF